VRTPLVDAQIASQAKAHGLPEQQVIEEIMLSRCRSARSSSEELGGYVEFLASDVARNITGSGLRWNGDGPPMRGHGKGMGG